MGVFHHISVPFSTLYLKSQKKHFKEKKDIYLKINRYSNFKCFMLIKKQKNEIFMYFSKNNS